MVALTWGDVGERFYEVGIDRGVFYPTVGNGVAWNGLVSVNETGVGGDRRPAMWMDAKELTLLKLEIFGQTLWLFRLRRVLTHAMGLSRSCLDFG